MWSPEICPCSSDERAFSRISLLGNSLAGSDTGSDPNGHPAHTDSVWLTLRLDGAVSRAASRRCHRCSRPRIRWRHRIGSSPLRGSTSLRSPIQQNEASTRDALWVAQAAPRRSGVRVRPSAFVGLVLMRCEPVTEHGNRWKLSTLIPNLDRRTRLAPSDVP